ncbi:MAG: glycosyltransferase family 39 protein [Cyanobacteria bacterium P01_C01_bin.69]
MKREAAWHYLAPDKWPDWKWVLVLTGAAIALWTISLGNVPLRDWDEGYRSVVVREMIQTKDWFYPTRFGAPYLTKPPFGYWVGAAGPMLFGKVNEFTLRFPMALFSALGVPLLYGVVRELSSRRQEAVISAGVYMTLLPVVRHGRLHMFDGFINTLLILSLFCLLRSSSRGALPSQKLRVWALGVGLSLMGIALSKGILAIAIGGIVFGFVVLDRRWTIFRNPYLWAGLAVGISLTAGWNIAQWQRYGDVFLQQHLGFQNVARITEAVDGNSGPPWTYFVQIAQYTFPWVLFWPGGLVLAWKSRRGSSSKSKGCLILTGTVLYMGMISVMQTKLPWYVMPVFPFMAMAVGWQVAQPVKVYAYLLRWVFAVGVLIGIGGIVYFAIADPQIPLILLGIGLAITMSLVTRQLTQRSEQYRYTLVIGLYGCLFLLMVSRSWIWELNESFSVVSVGAMVQAHVPNDEPFYASYRHSRPSLEFYAEHPMGTGDTEDLKQKRQEGFYLLLNSEALQALEIPSESIVDTAEGFSLVKP